MANKLISIIPSGTNNYLTPSLSLNRYGTDLVAPGIIGTLSNTSAVAPSTGSFAVNAQGSPNMTVAVSAGTLYMNATPSGGTAQTFAVTMDASENVTISANSTGGTRYDFVYAVASASALNNPAVTGLDVVTLTTQRSTTQYIDSNGAPSNSLLLAEVTVTNGASSIANSDIRDRRVEATTLSKTGWINANETWTYASSTTFTVPDAAAANKFATGDKIKLFQSGWKYFYVTGKSSTTITVTGGSDYTLANAVIQHAHYSKDASPTDFPQWFNYSPTYANFTVGNGTHGSRFKMDGRAITVNLKFTLGSTSAVTGFVNFTLPVTTASIYGGSSVLGWGGGTVAAAGYFLAARWKDTSTGEMVIVNTGTPTQQAAVSSTTPATWASTNYFQIPFTYEAA